MKFELWLLELICNLVLGIWCFVSQKPLTRNQPSDESFSAPSWGISFAGAFSGFFFSPSFAALAGCPKSRFARSFLLSFFLFLLLAISRSLSRLGMVTSLLREFVVISPVVNSSARRIAKNYETTGLRNDKTVISELRALTYGQSTQMANFFHGLMGQWNGIGLLLCKERAADTYLHLPSPS